MHDIYAAGEYLSFRSTLPLALCLPPSSLARPSPSPHWLPPTTSPSFPISLIRSPSHLYFPAESRPTNVPPSSFPSLSSLPCPSLFFFTRSTLSPGVTLNPSAPISLSLSHPMRSLVLSLLIAAPSWLMTTPDIGSVAPVVILQHHTRPPTTTRASSLNAQPLRPPSPSFCLSLPRPFPNILRSRGRLQVVTLYSEKKPHTTLHRSHPIAPSTNANPFLLSQKHISRLVYHYVPSEEPHLSPPPFERSRSWQQSFSFQPTFISTLLVVFFPTPNRH